MDESYNGFVNWETFEVYTCLANDESTYTTIMRHAVTRNVDQLAGVLRKGLGRSLHEEVHAEGGRVDYKKVDWREIAEAFKEE